MPVRKASARWEGSIKEGRGRVRTESGAVDAAYSFGSRFKDDSGTNPEELIGAAHAGCFAMALSLILEKAGFPPEYIEASARVTIAPEGDGFRITESQLTCEAAVPKIDEATFRRCAEDAKKGCPVSRALAGTTIGLEARLAGS